MNWFDRSAWVGFFDVLGFKNLINNSRTDLQLRMLKHKIEHLRASLDEECKQQGQLHYSQFADSIVIVAPNDQGSAYPWFHLACKSLVTRSIYERIPLRGAISAGHISYTIDPPVFVGAAILEAHAYCEDQDWVGLLLAPSAVAAARRDGLEPLNQHFASDNAIPLRKESKDGVLAYAFKGGATNFANPLLNFLDEMRQSAGKPHEHKYTNTMEFISRHHEWLK